MATIIRIAGRMLARLLPSGLPVPILKGPLRGAKWIVGAAAGEGKGLSIVWNLSETEQAAAAVRLAPKDGIVFDIGANVGFYTLLFARHSGHVFAFEPLPRNIGYLSKTLEVNRCRNVTVVPCAVAGSSGLFSFREGDNCALGKLDPCGDQPVMGISCDDFVASRGCIPSLLKIDVEGAEFEVLKGAEELLSRHRPDILLSTHGDELRSGCLRLLQDRGYGRFTPLDHAETDRASEFAISA